MDFKELTTIIRDRPPMWIGDYDIDYLDRFLGGWTYYERMNNVSDEFGLTFYNYFSWWLHNKIKNDNPDLHHKKCGLAMGYTNLIKILESDSKKQILLFFQLLDGFYNDYINGIEFEEIKNNLLNKK